MIPEQILSLVKQRSDERFGDTIDRLFSILKYKHTHECNKKDDGYCYCSYCKFIRNDYTTAKLHLHWLKIKLNKYDHAWSELAFNALDIKCLNEAVMLQVQRVYELKEYKQELKSDVL